MSKLRWYPCHGKDCQETIGSFHPPSSAPKYCPVCLKKARQAGALKVRKPKIVLTDVPPCPICAKPCKTKGNRIFKTCGEDTCLMELKRRNGQKQAGKVYKKKERTWINVECRRCLKYFLSPPDWQGKPLKHFCSVCEETLRTYSHYEEGVWA